MTETECIALKMGMFLFYAGPVRPTLTTASEKNRLLCSGVNNRSYICEFGHCCGESHCCSYYYELWWFWLVWAVIIILSCCCICHHRRSKHRLQQQQRQHEINLIAYREAHSYASLPFYFRFLPSYLLPDYEEVVNHPPTPPPPYSALVGSQSAIASPVSPEQPDGLVPPTQTTSAPVVSDTLSLRVSFEGPDPQAGLSQKADGKPQTSAEQLVGEHAASAQEHPGLGKSGDHEKELLPDSSSAGHREDKDRLLGRHRHFTGDSGIDVCVCSADPGNEERSELGGLLGDICDGCASCSQPLAPPPREEEQVPERRLNQGAMPLPRAPVSLLLHTISEQEGSHQPGNPGLQS